MCTNGVINSVKSIASMVDESICRGLKMHGRVHVQSDPQYETS